LQKLQKKEISCFFTFLRRGFVEILKETINRSWGLQHIMLPPPRHLGIPYSAITPEKVENNTPKNEGVKGMLPLGCLPLWGGEGVTLMAAAENKRITQKKRISTKPNFEFTLLQGTFF
jgi:hypothetical protein